MSQNWKTLAPSMAAPLHDWSSWERGTASSPARAESTVRIFPLLSAFLDSRYVAFSSDAMNSQQCSFIRRGQLPAVLRGWTSVRLLQQHHCLDSVASNLLPVRLGSCRRHDIRQLRTEAAHHWRDASSRLWADDGLVGEDILLIHLVSGSVQCHRRCMFILAWQV